MKRHSLSAKLGLAAAGLTISIVAAAAWLWYTFAGPGYYAEFNEIQARLKAMPNVALIEIGGNKDLTYEDIWAKIIVEGKGPIHLYSLSRDSFRHAPHMILGAIGPYSILVEGEGFVGAHKIETGEPVRSQFHAQAVDISKAGAFARFFPFTIDSIQDVITRYDDIVAALAQWPQAPHKEHFTDSDGTDYYYCVTRRTPSSSALTEHSTAD